MRVAEVKACLLVALFGALFISESRAQRLTSYVDPFIGTGGHGHTYPGATVPFGMVQLSPDNGTEGWDWCSGYHYSSNTIAGFSHTHLTGTGIGDWCDISVMPHTGLIQDTIKRFKTTFKHQNEKASPGYYAVTLDNGIKAQLTATERCGLHQYTFPQGSNPVIRFDLGFRINWDNPTETYIKQVNDSTIVGYRYSTGWAKVQRVYFAARTSVPFNQFRLYADGKVASQKQATGKLIKGHLIFPGAGGKTIEMKVALSTVSTDKAVLALGEIQGWNFDQVRTQAEDKWEQELQKIKVTSPDESRKRIFYSALYHTSLAPVLYSDADGAYQNAKGQTLKMRNGQRYTEYSLWDTFRAQNPLLTLTQPERYTSMLNSMLAFYDENGLLPVWDLSSWETNTMSGYHAVPVLADAVLKNWPGLDAEKAFAAMKKSANQTIRATPQYIKYGFIPQDKAGNSVTITLEYAYDDWCIAQVAKKLGKQQDYDTFSKRAYFYAPLFDKSTGFMRAKNADGTWVSPFDPYFSDHSEQAPYIEGNAWQHSFFVPHDVRGLAKLHGGKKQFVQKLDSLFMVSSVLKGENTSPDVSGLIGQYAHGNEPSHHIAYMYTYVGQPWKTQERIRMIVDSMYLDNPDGYSGNEDCGQMSAWGVWNLAGLYPANAASGQYVFGSPILDEVTFSLPGNKKMVLKTRNNGQANPYIQRVRLNGKTYAKTYIDHTTLLQGGELEFEMGPKPNKKWGTKPASWPGSLHE